MTDNPTSEQPPENEEFAIAIEWAGTQGGVQKASIGGGKLKELQEDSEKAVNIAMSAIRSMAYKVSKTLDSIEDKVRPNEAEVEFGVKFDAKAGVLLAQASAEGQIKVTLKWNIEQPERTKILVSE